MLLLLLLLHPQERGEKKRGQGGKGEGELFSLPQSVSVSQSPLRPTRRRRPSHSSATPRRSQPTRRECGGEGGGEGGRAAEVRSRKDRKRARGEGGGGDDGRANGREGGKSERQRRWGTDRTHSPPRPAVLSSASQTNSVTPPLLLYFCSIYRVLAECGVGTGERERRASEGTNERAREEEEEGGRARSKIPNACPTVNNRREELRVKNKRRRRSETSTGSRPSSGRTASPSGALSTRPDA